MRIRENEKGCLLRYRIAYPVRGLEDNSFQSELIDFFSLLPYNDRWFLE